MTQKRSIVWFRQDLRLADNPALIDACRAGDILPIYILDDMHAGDFKMGGASRVWLHHALTALNTALNGHLLCFKGSASEVLEQLIDTYEITDIYWNRCYEPWRIHRDKNIKATLDVNCHSSNGSLLWEPWTVLKNDGTPYKVFTPYYKNGCLQAMAPRKPMATPTDISFIKHQGNDDHTITSLNLLPSLGWGETITDGWSMDEDGIAEQCRDFISQNLQGYKEKRNFPSAPNISKLSPALHFGQISPNMIWHMVQQAGIDFQCEEDAAFYCSELGWREFSYYLLYHFPNLPTDNIQSKFDLFPWQKQGDLIEKWQKGQTGYPIIDAAMQELWQTGFMHNRLRMVVASFLVKNLLQDWRVGAAWFWDCLFDADLASNSASWQWVAGCGVDAAPYFRIFNPVTQGEKFDKNGDYIRKYLPVLKDVPAKFIHTPWNAPTPILQQANVTLGEDYPRPIVDLKETRARALEALAQTKTD